MRQLRYAALLLGLAASPAVIAQDDAADAVEQYQVEVLVFRHMDQSRNTEEIPRLVEPEIEDVLDQQLARLAAGRQAEDKAVPRSNSNAGRPSWRAADRNELFMQADANRLRNLQAYEVISHLAWVQTAEDVAVAEPLATTDLDRSAPLSGTLKLYRKRYLHLSVDLMLDKSATAGTNASFGQLLPVRQAGPAIVDSRRMRLGRTAYFDHPQFGVLATVNKLESN